MGQSVNWIGGMERSLSRYQLATSESHERGFGLGNVLGDRWKETKEMIYVQLDPIEKHVFDYSEGTHGKKKMNHLAISNKLQISNDKVFTIRKKIDRLFQTYH